MSGAKFNHDAILATMRNGLREGMNLCLVRAARLLRDQLSHPGRGTLYRVAQGKAKGRNLRARGFHRASFPGQSPAALTGSLRASWSVETVGDRPDGFANIFEDGREVILQFGSNLPYAQMLEYGTRRMKPRPYVSKILPRLAEFSEKDIVSGLKIAFARTQ
jgi:hypothetical protein